MGEVHAHTPAKPYSRIEGEETAFQLIVGTTLPLVSLTLILGMMVSYLSVLRYLVFVEIAVAALLLVWHLRKQYDAWYASLSVVASLTIFALTIYLFSGWY